VIRTRLEEQIDAEDQLTQSLGRLEPQLEVDHFPVEDCARIPRCHTSCEAVEIQTLVRARDAVVFCQILAQLGGTRLQLRRLEDPVPVRVNTRDDLEEGESLTAHRHRDALALDEHTGRAE